MFGGLLPSLIHYSFLNPSETMTSEEYVLLWFTRGMDIFKITFHGKWDRFWAETMFSYIQNISPLLFSHKKGKTSSLKIENPSRHHHNQVITLRFIVKYTDIVNPLIWWRMVYHVCGIFLFDGWPYMADCILPLVSLGFPGESGT